MAEYNKVTDQANQVAQTPYNAYGGELVSPVNAQQTSGINAVNSTAGVQDPYNAAAVENTVNGSGTITPSHYGIGAVNQYQSPYTTDVVKATEAQIQNQNQQQSSALTGNAISSGAFGGDRAGIAQAALAGQQDIASDQTIAGLYNQGFLNAQGEFNTQQAADIGTQENTAARNLQAGQQLGALGSAAQTEGLQEASAQLQGGTLQQQTQQAQDTANYNQFLQQQSYPFQTTGWLANIAEGIGSNSGGTSTGSSTTQGPPNIGGVIGAGLGLLSFLSRGGVVGRRAKGGVVPGFDMGGATPEQPPMSGGSLVTGDASGPRAAHGAMLNAGLLLGRGGAAHRDMGGVTIDYAGSGRGNNVRSPGPTYSGTPIDARPGAPGTSDGSPATGIVAMPDGSPIPGMPQPATPNMPFAPPFRRGGGVAQHFDAGGAPTNYLGMIGGNTNGGEPYDLPYSGLVNSNPSGAIGGGSYVAPATVPKGSTIPKTPPPGAPAPSQQQGNDELMKGLKALHNSPIGDHIQDAVQDAMDDAASPAADTLASSAAGLDGIGDDALGAGAASLGGIGKAAGGAVKPRRRFDDGGNVDDYLNPSFPEGSIAGTAENLTGGPAIDWGAVGRALGIGNPAPTAAPATAPRDISATNFMNPDMAAPSGIVPVQTTTGGVAMAGSHDDLWGPGASGAIDRIPAGSLAAESQYLQSYPGGRATVPVGPNGLPPGAAAVDTRSPDDGFWGKGGFSGYVNGGLLDDLAAPFRSGKSPLPPGVSPNGEGVMVGPGGPLGVASLAPRDSIAAEDALRVANPDWKYDPEHAWRYAHPYLHADDRPWDMESADRKAGWRSPERPAIIEPASTDAPIDPYGSTKPAGDLPAVDASPALSTDTTPSVVAPRARKSRPSTGSRAADIAADSAGSTSAPDDNYGIPPGYHPVTRYLGRDGPHTTLEPIPGWTPPVATPRGVVAAARPARGVSAAPWSPPGAPAAVGSAPATTGVAPVASAPALGAIDAATSKAASTIAVKNNNPGNLVDSAWTRTLPGYAGSVAGYAKFDTPENGWAAADHNLRSYAAQGLDTPAKIAASWAPADDGSRMNHGNSPTAYATRIAADMGVGVNDRIDMSDPSTRSRLAQSIAGVEAGVPAASASALFGTPPTASASAAIDNARGSGSGVAPAAPANHGVLGGVRDWLWGDDASNAGATPTSQRSGMFGFNFDPATRQMMLATGAGIMGGTSPYALANIGQGITKGLETTRANAGLQSEIGLRNAQTVNQTAEARKNMTEAQIQQAQFENLQKLVVGNAKQHTATADAGASAADANASATAPAASPGAAATTPQAAGAPGAAPPPAVAAPPPPAATNLKPGELAPGVRYADGWDPQELTNTAAIAARSGQYGARIQENAVANLKMMQESHMALGDDGQYHMLPSWLAQETQRRAADLNVATQAAVAKTKAEGAIAPGVEYAKEGAKNVAEDEKGISDSYIPMAQSRQRMTTLTDLMRNYQTGHFAEAKADAVSIAKGLGLPVPNFADGDAKAFQEFTKNATANVFNQASQLRGRILVNELEGLKKANADPSLQPEANAAILAQGIGLLDAEKAHADDYLAWRQTNANSVPSPTDVARFNSNWVKTHNVQDYVDNAAKQIGYQGQTVPPATARTLDQVYRTPKGVFRWTAQGWAPAQ